MPIARRLGAIHSERPASVRALASLARLPAPRAETDWLDGIDFSAGPDPTLGNAGAGDCVEASAFQIIRVRAHHAWGPNSYLPTAAQALALYALCTGYDPSRPETDVGTDANAFMARWASKGILLGDPANNVDVVGWTACSLEDMPVAVDTAGPVRVTLALPRALEAAPIEAWTKAPLDGDDWQPGTWGMHSVVVGGQRGGFLNVLTWGETVWAHPLFMARYWKATDVGVSRFWLDTTGRTPAGMDWPALASVEAELTA